MNILPALDRWRTYYPENLLPPKFSQGGGLCISFPDEEHRVGKWICETEIKGGRFYTFEAWAESNRTVNDTFAIITTKKSDGAMCIRDHAMCFDAEQGKNHFLHTFETDAEACSVTVELWLKGNGGRVKWTEPTLFECAAPEKRSVRVATTYINPYIAKEPTFEVNLANILAAIDNASAISPDIILLSEGMYGRNIESSAFEKAITEDDRVCRLISERAKQYSSYIVFNFHEREERFVYNTSILYDRNGNIAGKYRKTHLTVTELEAGIVPGNEMCVFDTDFGRIGLLVCWDQYFPETAKKLAEKGAEIIFVSTAGDAKTKTPARAEENGVYMVVSGVNTHNTYGWKPSSVIAPNGEILAETCEHLGFAHYDIDLTKKTRVFWLAMGPACSEARGVFVSQKNPNIF